MPPPDPGGAGRAAAVAKQEPDHEQPCHGNSCAAVFPENIVEPGLMSEAADSEEELVLSGHNSAKSANAVMHGKPVIRSRDQTNPLQTLTKSDFARLTKKATWKHKQKERQQWKKVLARVARVQEKIKDGTLVLPNPGQHHPHRRRPSRGQAASWRTPSRTELSHHHIQ